MKKNNSITIAIVHPNQNAYSETFIRSHIDNLPCKVIEFDGGIFPRRTRSADIFNLNSKTLNVSRIVRIFLQKQKEYPYFFSKLIKKIFQYYKVDAVLAEYGPTGEKILPVCRELNIPLIVHFHGFDAHRRSTIEEYGNYKHIFSEAAAVIGVSQKMCEQLKTLGCPEIKLHYIVYGIGDIFFNQRLPENTLPKLVCIGRFTPKKAPYFTVMAFAKAVKSVPEARLIMIGTGTELIDVCWQMTKMYGIEDKVHFVGVKSPDEIAQILSTSRAFIQHSVEAMDGNSEGTPVAVLEACAVGVPVISTFHAGISDVVIHEKTGLLVGERDIEGMAKNMVRVLENEPFARQMGQEAKKHMQQNYRSEISIKKIMGCNLWYNP